MDNHSRAHAEPNWIFRCVSISSTYPGESVSWLVLWSITLVYIFVVCVFLQSASFKLCKFIYYVQKLNSFCTHALWSRYYGIPDSIYLSLGYKFLSRWQTPVHHLITL